MSWRCGRGRRVVLCSSLLPDSLRAKLGGVVRDPLADVDAVCVGWRGLGTENIEATLLVRGRLLREKLWQSIVSQPGSREVTYHGMPVAEVDQRAWRS
jgi:hypothetical protein